MDDLKKISCDPQCGFVIQSHNENEVISFAVKHVKEMHGKTVSDKELKAMMTTVS